MTRRTPSDDPPHQATTVPTPRVGFEPRPWFLASVLVIVTFVAYQPTWHAGFIWDDDDHLTANSAVAAPNGLKLIWSSLAVSRYYPLTLTTFWVQRRLWGLNPRPYHLVNVALHAANGVLVFFLLRRLRVRAAWLAAMVWTLHPVNVESVAWITELKNTQSGLFFFLAVLFFLRSEASARRRWYGLALLCGLAALLSKPSTVVLPVALLLCVWWEHGVWRRADILRVVPFFLLALGMSALTVVEQRGAVRIAGSADWNLGMAQRLVLAGKAVWFYASKALWPARLTFVYPHWNLNPGSLISWLPLAGLVVGGMLLGLWRRQSWARAAWFGCSFFVLSLLPVLGFFDVYYFRYSYVADHFQYLASLGLISLTVSTGAIICERAGRRGRHFGTLASVVMLLTLGLSTRSQAHIYQDMQTLWDDTLTKNPACWMAHNNLGLALASSGRMPEAMEHFKRALQLKPDYAEAHNNLGIALSQAGELDQAVLHYQQALSIKPDYDEAQFNLATALVRLGRLREAIEHFDQALRIDPDDAEAHYNLGNALWQVGQPEKAIVHYEQALRINPNFTPARTALARLQAGR